MMGVMEKKKRRTGGVREGRMGVAVFNTVVRKASLTK